MLEYFDNILIFGVDREQNNECLHKVLQKLQKVDFALNDKCEFAMENMCVGHKRTADGIEPDPNKVKPIMEMPDPENVADVSRVLGTAVYLAKFPLSEKE